MDTLPYDIIYEFTLRSDIKSLCVLCITNKYLYNLIYNNAFWIEKCKYEHLPIPYIGDDWNLDNYESHFRHFNYPKNYTWINIYKELLKASIVAKRIIIVNKVEKYAAFRPTNGEIHILSILTYKPYGLPFILDDLELPSHLCIKLLDNMYSITYTIFNRDYTNYITKTAETDEHTILLILTSICFDISIRYPDLNITDNNGYSFISVYKNVYDFTYARRIGILQSLKFKMI